MRVLTFDIQTGDLPIGSTLNCPSWSNSFPLVYRLGIDREGTDLTGKRQAWLDFLVD